MRKIIISVVKNDDDIIESFIKENSKYVDHIYIGVHYPDGNLEAIIEKMRNENYPVTKLSIKIKEFNQGLITTQLYHEVSYLESKMDICYFLDCDEFINSTSEIERKYESGKVFTSARYETLYLGDKEPLNRVRNKLQSSKSIICHDKKSYKNYKIGAGNHFVYINNEKALTEELETKIIHVPYRSAKQYVTKILGSWTTMLLHSPEMAFKEDVKGKHWKDNYQKIIKSGFDYNELKIINQIYNKDKEELIEDSFVYDNMIDLNINKEESNLVNDKLLLKWLTTNYMLMTEKAVYFRKRDNERGKELESQKVIESKMSIKKSLFNRKKSLTIPCVLVNGTKPYTEEYYPTLKKSGNVISITGAITIATNDPVIEFPIEYAPKNNIQFLMTGSNNTINSWQVQNKGYIKLLTPKVDTKNKWYPINITWILS